ncbi:MAG: Ig-like domain-containing protein, partial [Bacteroidetes bacterium]|nr:Ig-like domain-containing protein [Bacteroidota bacterium]
MLGIFKYTIIILSLIITANLSAAEFYVDKDASGANNGTSWNNAWTSFNSINWGQINPGDIIYVSGGSTSKTYYGETIIPGKSGSSGNSITITKGITSGHNGEVIMNGNGNTSYGFYIGGSSKSWITLEHITFTGYTSNGTIYVQTSTSDRSVGLKFRYLNLSQVTAKAFRIKHMEASTVEYCTITTCSNCSGQTDGIFIQYGINNIIQYNNIVISNTNSSGHNDLIQALGEISLIIRYNYLEHDDEPKGSNTQGVVLANGGGFCQVYGNIIKGTNTNYSTMLLWQFDNKSGSGDYVHIYNNTLIGGNANPALIRIYKTGANHKVFNNIFYSTRNGVIGFIRGIPESNVNYNLWLNASGGNILEFDGTTMNFTELQSAGIDVNGVNANPLFTDLPGKDYSLRSGSPAIDAAFDLGASYNGSYNGIQRPQGAGWDIGAFENYSGPDVTPPQLQGAVINSPTQVALTFSESLDSQSAQNVSNYSIDNGISVISAVLSSNNKIITLTTSEHTSTQQYTVTVNNVTDLAGNTIDPQANSAQYFFEVDTTPPQLLSAFAIVPTQVTLFFSETLDPQSAKNVSNYNINNGISIIDAVLNSNNTDVTLTTSAHDANQTYTATVNNVTDLSGNVISPNNNSADYQLIILSGPVFPIDLFGTPESEKTVTFNLSLPGNMPDLLTYHMIAFDADHGGNDPPEGHAFINGNGPLELFPGAT